MEKDKEFTVARLILRMANQIVKNRNLHVDVYKRQVQGRGCSARL